MWEKVQSLKIPVTKETEENLGFSDFELRFIKKCAVEIVLDDVIPLNEDEILIDLFGTDDSSALKKEKKFAS